MTQPDAPPTSTKHDRGPFIGTMIAIAAVLFLSTSVVLYWRWSTTTEPSCVITVDTSAAWRGAEVTVDAITLAKPHHVTVGDGDRFAFAIYVDPGIYTIKVMAADEVQLETNVEFAKPHQLWRVDLTRKRPTTAPVLRPKDN